VKLQLEFDEFGEVSEVPKLVIFLVPDPIPSDGYWKTDLNIFEPQTWEKRSRGWII